LNIQPDEGISVSFGAKRPGTEMSIGNVTMNFSYREGFGGVTTAAPTRHCSTIVCAGECHAI